MKNTFSVRPDWRDRGFRCNATDYKHALRQAIEHWPSDERLYRYDHPGTAFQRFDWGVRLEREQQYVDIVEVR